MTALAADRDLGARNQGAWLDYPPAASQTFYLGAIVALNGDGKAVPAADTAGLKVVGFSAAKATSGASVASDEVIGVRTQVDIDVDSSGISQDDVGQMAYVLDDQTVTNYAGSTNHVAAGRISAYLGDDRCRVTLCVAPLEQSSPSEVLRFTATLAADETDTGVPVHGSTVEVVPIYPAKSVKFVHATIDEALTGTGLTVVLSFNIDGTPVDDAEITFTEAGGETVATVSFDPGEVSIDAESEVGFTYTSETITNTPDLTVWLGLY